MICFAMDAHPIPQNVTSFQFKLVGSMTLKQFMYLSIGATIAYINFVFLTSSLPLIAWPMILVSASLGAAFAFLPIVDRPLDHWAKAFLKAVYSPTKMSWSKNNKIYKENPLFFKRIELLQHSNAPHLIQQIPQIIPRPFTPIQAQPAPDLPSQEELSKTIELAKESQSLQMKIIETQKELDQIRNASSVTGADPEHYSEDINKIMTNLNQLITQASQIKKNLAVVTHTPESAKQPAGIEIVTATKPKQTQLVLTTSPNVINGIITDSQNNYLDSVVAVIYNKEGLPVRALKTNKLGQFSGATPLPNGKYNLQLEKDNLVFDVYQITLEGKVLSPIAISAKKLVNP